MFLVDDALSSNGRSASSVPQPSPLTLLPAECIGVFRNVSPSHSELPPVWLGVGVRGEDLVSVKGFSEAEAELSEGEGAARGAVSSPVLGGFQERVRQGQQHNNKQPERNHRPCCLERLQHGRFQRRLHDP